jgi:hypothetical protein
MMPFLSFRKAASRRRRLNVPLPLLKHVEHYRRFRALDESRISITVTSRRGLDERGAFAVQLGQACPQLRKCAAEREKSKDYFCSGQLTVSVCPATRNSHKVTISLVRITRASATGSRSNVWSLSVFVKSPRWRVFLSVPCSNYSSAISYFTLLSHVLPYFGAQCYVQLTLWYVLENANA